MLNAALELLHQIELDVDNEAQKDYMKSDETRANYF